MICISVTPESRTLAKVDILNASTQGDLIEVCLDKLIKTPDVGDMISGFEKPILVSCRRKQDGGDWNGSEDDRMQLMRTAIVAGPAYIELDLELAGKIPRFGETKRVISYTSLDKPLERIDAIFERARDANADVVKFTWPTPDLDGAWPLLRAVSQKRDLPVVGMGLGESSVMFSLLGLKYGSPWIYAALEKGMEAHAGQATVSELDEIYCWQDIDSETRFIGVVETGDTGVTTCRILNAGFRHHDLPWRCLPMQVGHFDKLKDRLDRLRMNALLLSPHTAEQMLEFIDRPEEAVTISSYADLLFKRDGGWHGYNTIWRAALRAIEKTLGAESPEDRPLDKRSVLLIGATGATRAIANGILKRKGVLSLSAPSDKQARMSAEKMGVRFVPYTNLYDTLADLVVIADPSVKMGHHKNELNPTFLREHMTLMDIGGYPDETELAAEAKSRGCRVVDATAVYAEQLSAQFKSITGQELPEAIVQSGLDG